MIRLARSLERAAHTVAVEMRAARLTSQRFQHYKINYVIAALGEQRPERGTYFGPVEVEGAEYSVYMMPTDAGHTG